MKSYTDIEQSRKLAEILPIESADMHWSKDFDGSWFVDLVEYTSVKIPKYVGNVEEHLLPCWSLAALSEFILPYIADNDGNNYKFYLSKDGLDRWVAYYKSDNVSIHICEESDNMIDVILEMVYWLKNEEYI